MDLTTAFVICFVALMAAFSLSILRAPRNRVWNVPPAPPVKARLWLVDSGNPIVTFPQALGPEARSAIRDQVLEAWNTVPRPVIVLDEADSVADLRHGIV